ncbi:MAG: hypothetical protein L0Z73_09050 [Gammaproteobacteria bacterium]|nr:hypothetical protein [Gammaproteobacteria bacterium]
MNLKRFSLAVAAIFVFALLWNGVVHMVLLKEANQALDQIARPMAERNMVLGLMLTAGIAILFVYSYASCARVAGIRYAVGHGTFFGLVAGLFVDLNQFLLYPIPASLAATWFAFGFLEFCIYGILVSWLYPVAAQHSTPGDAPASGTPHI